MIDFKNIISDFCIKNNLKIKVSTKMPVGYEFANGTFDIEKNTLFYNAEILAQAPDYEALFYLFHELRHVQQYKIPQSFPKAIQQSLNYVLMYDGTCYKMINGTWIECKLDGSKEYLENVYMCQPYEIDANNYAYEQVKRIYGSSKELDKLYSFWIPKIKISDDEYMKIYEIIDSKINNIKDAN